MLIEDNECISIFTRPRLLKKSIAPKKATLRIRNKLGMGIVRCCKNSNEKHFPLQIQSFPSEFN